MSTVEILKRIALGCRRLSHWPRAPNQLFHVSCSCLDAVRARVSFVNIARAASLRQSTATRDFRSLPVNGATLESARWPLVASLSYCRCRSPVKSSSCEQVGESSPYTGPLYRKEARSRFRRGC